MTATTVTAATVTAATVIFDLDGTLIDTVQLHLKTFVQAFREFGFDVSEEKILETVGRTGLEIIKLLSNSEKSLEIYKRKNELFMEWFNQVNEIEGATTVLTELKKRGHKLAIATSGNKTIMGLVLEKFGWTFDMIMTAEDVTHGKPNPEMLNKIKEKLPAPFIFIGDTQFDKDAGDSANIKTIILGRDFDNLSELLDMKSF